jgi:hypothetical protein
VYATPVDPKLLELQQRIRERKEANHSKNKPVQVQSKKPKSFSLGMKFSMPLGIRLSA